MQRVFECVRKRERDKECVCFFKKWLPTHPPSMSCACVMAGCRLGNLKTSIFFLHSQYQTPWQQNIMCTYYIFFLRLFILKHHCTYVKSKDLVKCLFWKALEPTQIKFYAWATLQDYCNVLGELSITRRLERA
jgi:hypothetical protein